MKGSRFKKLIKKYQFGKLSTKAKKVMDDWFDSMQYPSSSWTENEMNSLKNRLFEQIQEQERVSKKSIFWRRTRIAAALFVFSLSIGLYLYQDSGTGPQEEYPSSSMVVPGGNKATLRINDGEAVQLNPQKFGILNQDHIFRYSDGSEIGLNLANDQAILSLETPRGGQYHVTLSDGTNVFLNAESKLTYPAKFDSQSRVVQLEGEAYFEVNRKEDSSLDGKFVPFFVEMAGQQVEVLGTTFNLNDYSADNTIITTLVEGKVKVAYGEVGKGTKRPSFTLAPGQQSILKGGQVAIKTMDTNEALAWQHGNFMFSDESIESVMLKLARWYDVEVDYEKGLGDVRIWGSLSRSQQIHEVLNAIELTSLVKFKLIGRRVYVMKP